jgi:hypothetical protein
MSTVKISIDRDRLPHPIRAIRNLMSRLVSASPISVTVEDVQPVKLIISDSTKSKVQPEMDGSPALDGELSD